MVVGVFLLWSLEGVHELLAQRQRGGFQAQGMRRRRVQAWIFCFGRRTGVSVVSSATPTLSTAQQQQLWSTTKDKFENSGHSPRHMSSFVQQNRLVRQSYRVPNSHRGGSESYY